MSPAPECPPTEVQRTSLSFPRNTCIRNQGDVSGQPVPTPTPSARIGVALLFLNRGGLKFSFSQQPAKADMRPQEKDLGFPEWT